MAVLLAGVRRWLLPSGLIISLLIAACTGGPAAKASPTAPAPFPTQVRIVRSADVTLPPLRTIASNLPGANQRDVAFVDARTGFLASGGQEIGTDQGGIYNPIAGGIARTVDGGRTWQTVWSQPGADMSAITFLSPTIGFAAGRTFSTSETTTDVGQPIWLRTVDGGATWTTTVPQMPTAAAQAWWSLHFVAAASNLFLAAPNPNVAAIDNQSLMLRSSDGGLHWSQVGPPGWIPSGGVAFSTPSVAYAGGFLTSPESASASARLWTSRDGGQTWRAVAGTNLPFGLYAVDFPDRLHGFAAGGNFGRDEMRPYEGLIASSDGGRSWSVRYQSPDSVRSNPITTLDLLDGNHGWASIGGCTEGENGPCAGPVLLTHDGGRSWQSGGGSAVAISAASTREAWILGGGGPGPTQNFAWHTTNGGASWSPVVRLSSLGINVLAGSDGWLVAVTPAGAWESRDNAESWSPIKAPMLTPLQQPGPASLVARPPGLLVTQTFTGLRLSDDAGASSFDVTLPGWDPNGSTQIIASFSDASHGVAIVGGRYCVKPPGYTGADQATPPPGVPLGVATLDVTTDGGRTWSEQGTLGALPWGVADSPGLLAIAASSGCAIAHPVLLISRDGGKHWLTQTVPNDCAFLGAASPKTVWLTCGDSLLVSQDGVVTWTSYHFSQGPPLFLVTGATDGWAYGPAGALWRTTDAGRDWRSVALPF